MQGTDAIDFWGHGIIKEFLLAGAIFFGPRKPFRNCLYAGFSISVAMFPNTVLANGVLFIPSAVFEILSEFFEHSRESVANIFELA